MSMPSLRLLTGHAGDTSAVSAALVGGIVYPALTLTRASGKTLGEIFHA